ncbi:uncharacterized protein KD926_008960 [Aspergillus affinis]|uniref:uncharacterized protein n=1 Tax=Aspergillus affinis TaxID=1070780 RepID=UPI0022FE96DD|nr:uncharacterized protein KD926_008960 [Aspergillus affinis]KAI9039859.1 hypothetical protein KD926_008960 [Aspergillus affinis]
MAEEFDNTMPYLDGELYGKIRAYHLAHQLTQSAKWKSRIVSSSKRRDYDRLHDNKAYKPLCEALDLMLQFPAVLAGFNLGSLRRFFRMKCAEELAASVRYIYIIWTEIMCGLPGHLLDMTSVNYLQGRTPRWSPADRSYIDALFENRALFADVQDPVHRNLLRERLFAFNGIIPSITTFLENTKYLEPAAILLRALVPSKFTGTLRQQMMQHFSQNTVSNVEFWPEYQRLWLVALRVFPYLTTFKPLQDKRSFKAEYTGNYWGFLARSAINHGFDSTKIRQTDKNYPTSDRLPEIVRDPRLSTSVEERWKLGRRCGMPTESMFDNISPYMCLENIQCTLLPDPGVAAISVFAVAREAFLSFFHGDGGHTLDSLSQAPPIPGAPENVSADGSSVDTIMHPDDDVDMSQDISTPTNRQPATNQLTRPLALPPVPPNPPIGQPQTSGEVTPFPGSPGLHTTGIYNASSDHSPFPAADALNMQPALIARPHDISAGWNPQSGTPLTTLSQSLVHSSSRTPNPHLWAASVPREKVDLRPKDIKDHLKNREERFAIYAYDRSILHFFDRQQFCLLENFLHGKERWWFAAYEGDSLITIDHKSLQSYLERSSFVICGYDPSNFLYAQRNEPGPGLRLLGLRSLGLRSLGLRSLGLRSLGLRSLGLRSLGLRIPGPTHTWAYAIDERLQAYAYWAYAH